MTRVDNVNQGMALVKRGPAPLALRPNTCAIVLVICDRHGEEKLYRLTVVHGPSKDGQWAGIWTLENYSDKTQYYLCEHNYDELTCTCIGFERSPLGVGCKHVRAFRAARSVMVCQRLARPVDQDMLG